MVPGDLQTILLPVPAIVTTDTRLNEPRYALLHNIVSAKQKSVTERSAADCDVDTTPRRTVRAIEELARRATGVMVGSGAELKEAGFFRGRYVVLRKWWMGLWRLMQRPEP